MLVGWSDPDAPIPPGWLGRLRAAAQTPVTLADSLAASPTRLPDRLEPGELNDVLGRGLAFIIANQPEDGGDILLEVLRHPLADSRSAAMADLALILADGLISVQQRGEALEPSRIENVASVLERCGLGWAARMSRASLALTTQADGCAAAHTVHETCVRNSDPWGAALALLLEGTGRLLRHEDADVAFDAATLAFSELGAASVIELIGQLRVPSSPERAVADVEPAAESMSVRCFAALEIMIDEVSLDLSTVRPRALSVLRLLALNAGRS